jgi:hypothetical protein
MVEHRKENRIKEYLLRKWSNFREWFIDKEHPRSRLNRTVFLYDLLKLIGLILIFLILYSNTDRLNEIVLLFIKLGSLLQLILLFFIFRKAWHLLINLKYAFRGLNNGIKATLAILVVLLLIFAFLNQGEVIDSITETYDKINFSRLNPFAANLTDFSFGNFSLSKLIGGSIIKCQSDFDEDIRKAKIKNSDLRVKVVEKKSFEHLNDATEYIKSWDVDNGDNTIKYIKENPQTQVNNIDLILVRYDFRECLFGECLDYSQLKFSVCKGEQAIHPKGTLFGDIFGGLFG